MKLEVRDVSWAADGVRIVREATLECAPGSFVGLIGPNGSGKSSLLRTIYRVVKPDAGVIACDGSDLWRMAARAASRSLAVVAQDNAGAPDFTVREIVAMGRSPHKRLLERDTLGDIAIVESALARVGLARFADRRFPTLSGGEKQRAIVARALAQQPRLLVLDEPTNHLDIHHQFEVLDVMRDLGVTVLAALHDLNLAAFYCDHLYVLHDGAVIASGTPNEVLTPARIWKVYGVRAEVEVHPATGRLHIVFLPAKAGGP